MGGLVPCVRPDLTRPHPIAPKRLNARSCAASDIIFIGDRYLTDIVFGNRHGMLTVRVAPMTLEGEPPGACRCHRVILIGRGAPLSGMRQTGWWGGPARHHPTNQRAEPPTPPNQPNPLPPPTTGVIAARKIEEWCVSRWVSGGVKAPPHGKLPPSKLLQVVKDPAE